MGYSRQAVKGITWVGMLRGSTRVITILRTAILARILTPSQFGIFGIAALALAFFEIVMETGINVFLIQEKKDIKEYINSAWVVSILRGFLLFTLIICLTPIIVYFFNVPQAVSLLLLISIVPVIRGFINPSIVILQKELKFQKEFYLKFSMFLVESLVVIMLAVITHSALSFVWGLIIGAIFEVIVSFTFIKPRPSLHIEMPKVKRIIGKGKWVTMYGIFSYVAQEGDNVVVGKMLGVSSLGIYSVAYKFSTLPLSEITDVINRVVFPVYSKISDDKKRLRSAFIKISLLGSLTSVIFGTLVFIFANEIVFIILGNQWTAAIPIIRVLAIYGTLRAILASFSPVFLSVGRQDYVAGMTFVRVAGLIVTIIPFILWYGLIGAAYAAIVSILVEIPIILYYTFKVFGKGKTSRA